MARPASPVISPSPTERWAGPRGPSSRPSRLGRATGKALEKSCPTGPDGGSVDGAVPGWNCAQEGRGNLPLLRNLLISAARRIASNPEVQARAADTYESAVKPRLSAAGEEIGRAHV